MSSPLAGGAVAGNEPAELEGLAEALYRDGDYAAAAAHYERAYGGYRRAGDIAAAGRVARILGWISGFVLGDWAVQRGWFGRARSILAQAGPDRPEHAWVVYMGALAEPDLVVREGLVRETIAVSRRCGDPDLELEALAFLGALLVTTDRVEEGLALLDEALAGACAGELTDESLLDSIFCLFFWSCEFVTDVPRAEQWMRAADETFRRRGVLAAHCRSHYGGILTAAGRWTEAERQLLEAARCFDQGMRGRRDAAVIRLADLRLRQGRLEEAALLVAELAHHPDAVGVLAALHLARGELAIARDLLERSTQGQDRPVPDVGASTMLGPLLALLVDVRLEEGDLPGAATAAGRLGLLAGSQQGPYLKALASLAQGQVCLASGEGDARASLHDALAGFARAQLPMELARTQLALARALAPDSPEAAVAAAKAALAGFEQLAAARHADAAGALLRELGAPIRTGPKGLGALTRREAEVLELIGAGLSNPEISDRLYIARKTVEHHVGNVLSKLGLRNRAEAAAYAARQKLRP